jgi:hypothetical protein
LAFAAAIKSAALRYGLSTPVTRPHSIVPTSETASKSFSVSHGIFACMLGTIVTTLSLNAPNV